MAFPALDGGDGHFGSKINVGAKLVGRLDLLDALTYLLTYLLVSRAAAEKGAQTAAASVPKQGRHVQFGYSRGQVFPRQLSPL